MPHKQLTVGIIVPANNRAGPQKLAALFSNDLARLGHKILIFVPRLPYFYYMVTLKRDPIGWLKVVRHHITSYFKAPLFSYNDLIESDYLNAGIQVHNVLRRPSQTQLCGLDFLLVMTIAQIEEMKSLYPPERTIYYLLHPEEMAYGYEKTIQTIRSNFKGKIIALSPWTARKVCDHILEPPVVPAVISPTIWANKRTAASRERDKDILFHYDTGGNKGSELGSALIKKICELRPETSVTLWRRNSLPDNQHSEIVCGFIPERKLIDMYLSHKMLLFPSSWEGFGMPPIEGIACGCLPILRSGVGAADLYVRDNDNAILIQEDLDETAEKIARLLDNDKQLEKMRIPTGKALEPFNPIGCGKRLLTSAGVNSNQNP